MKTKQLFAIVALAAAFAGCGSKPQTAQDDLDRKLDSRAQKPDF